MKKIKDTLVNLIQKAIQGLEWVINLVSYLTKALEYLRKALDYLKSDESKEV
jgi:hypothetical protein